MIQWVKKMRNILFVILAIIWGRMGNLSHANILVAVKSGNKVVLGTDSRVSSNGGRIVSNRRATKLHRLSKSCTLCYVGGIGSEFNQLCRDLEAVLLLDEYPSYVSAASGAAMECLSPRAVAQFARRLINVKYRSLHVVVAGCTHSAAPAPSRGRAHDLDADADADADTGADVCIVEVAPNGFTVEHAESVACGSAAVSVLGLFEQVLSSSSDDGEDPLIGVQRVVRSVVETAISLDPRCGGPAQVLTLT